MRWLRAESGSAMVEFALIVPVLFLLLIAMFDVARAMNAYVTLSSAAREGSHYAALHPTAAPAAIASAATARVSPLDPAAITVEASYSSGGALASWPAGGIPASSPVPTAIATQVRVSYPWQAATSVLGRFFATSSFSASSTTDTLR